MSSRVRVSVLSGRQYATLAVVDSEELFDFFSWASREFCYGVVEYRTSSVTRMKRKVPEDYDRFITAQKQARGGRV